MKIAMLASSYPRFAADGAARFNHSIAESLVKLGHDVHVVVPFSPEMRPMDTSVHIHSFKYAPFHRLNIMGYAKAMHSDRRLNKLAILLAPLFFLSAFFKLIVLVQSKKIDVIHAHWVIPNGFIAACVGIILRKPVFISLHGSDIFFALKNKWLGILARWTFQQISGGTACSPELYAGALQLDAPPEKIFLIPWGANPEIFKQNDVARKQIRENFNVTPNDILLIGVGRLVGKKGFKYLIEAISILKKNTKNVKLLLVGDGPEYKALQNLSTRLGIEDAVFFAGEITWGNIPSYLSAADIFIMPSIHDNGNVDGLPTVIPEAMAVGKPIVASDVGGISMVVHNAFNGFLVEEKDAYALADAITRIIKTGMIEKMGQQSRQLVEERFNWINVATAFEEMYLHKPVNMAVLLNKKV